MVTKKELTMSDVVFKTEGNFLWSSEKRTVRIVNIKLGKGLAQPVGPIIAGAKPSIEYFTIWGELRVYFDTETWDTKKHGLIFMDERFMRELQKFLNVQDLPGREVCYSELGMQGDDYVSLDVGTDFYHAWMKKFNIAIEEIVDFSR